MHALGPGAEREALDLPGGQQVLEVGLIEEERGDAVRVSIIAPHDIASDDWEDDSVAGGAGGDGLCFFRPVLRFRSDFHSILIYGHRHSRPCNRHK